MDISEEEEFQQKREHDRMTERGLFWNPRTIEKRKAYHSWLEKQAKQRQKTLELEGTVHSRGARDQLKRSKRMFEEEAKRIKDLIEDGR